MKRLRRASARAAGRLRVPESPAANSRMLTSVPVVFIGALIDSLYAKSRTCRFQMSNIWNMLIHMDMV